MDGSLALALVIILGFSVFIFWAKTNTGRMALRHTFGEPHSLKKRQRLARRTAAKSGGTKPKPRSGH